ALHHAFGGIVAGKTPAGEIVGAGVADVLDDAGVDVAEIDEVAGQRLGVGRRQMAGQGKHDYHSSRETSRHRWGHFSCTVIPGWSEGPDPESRDSGFDAPHRPGMTEDAA